MLIDRSQRGWIVFTLIAFVIAAAYYCQYAQQASVPPGNGPTGGSVTGLTYGIIGFSMMIFCGLLGVRRRVRIWKLGRGQAWLRAHIWLGLLAFPIIYFHAGMRFGHGLTLWLMILFAVVVVTGIFGVIVQNFIPKTLLNSVAAESTFEQIPNVVNILRREADSVVASVCGPIGNETPAEVEAAALVGAAAGGAHSQMKREGPVQGKVMRSRPQRAVGEVEGAAPLKQFYLTEIQPFLDVDFHSGHKLATQKSSIALFAHAKTLLPDSLHEILQDLESICEERRQLALQIKLHKWLHTWEFVHIPISYALLAMSVIHAIKATFNY